MKNFKLASVIALALVGLTAIAASAAGPYVSGTAGYDVSYPNCSATPPSGSAFGIVGVNGGRPFTTNSCFGAEYTTAASTGSASVYINTGYSGAYRKNITSRCASLVSTSGLSGSAAQAWEIGCSEGDMSHTDVGASKTPVVWWLDVETGNSWSSSNLALNQDTIQGAAAGLKADGAAYVGVYSTAASWKTITGGSYTPSSADAEWVAGGSCATPFDADQVWLSQQGTVGGVDTDFAC